MTSLEAFGALGALGSIGYLAVAHVCFGRWARETNAPIADDAASEPITFFRPLKRGVPDLRAKLEAQIGALREADELLLGVDADAPEAVLGDELRAAFPQRRIVVVRCGAAPAGILNPKVAKLVQMAPHARHERWIVADSEATLGRAWVDAFRHEWASGSAEVLTAGYRLDGARTWAQRLDAAGVLVTLWPGLAVLHAAAAIHFTLGACVAVRRLDLEAIGGWAAFGDALAEDNQLGAALAAAGRRIRLSRQVVALACDPLTWREWWQHQMRSAVTYRVGNPAGYAGSVITMGEMWALLMIASGAWWGVGLFFAVWIVRTVVAGRMARTLGFSMPGLSLAVLGASLVGSVCWALSWGVHSVVWGGRRWRVSFSGKLRGI